MATNPMQKNARNSFLIGMLITLVITGAIIALLIMQLTNTRKEIATLQAAKEEVCVLMQNVKSGQVITDDMVDIIEVDKGAIPANSFQDNINNLVTYRLEDAKGNTVGTKIVKDETTGEETPKLYITEVDSQTKESKDRFITTLDGENYYYEDTEEKVDLTSVPLVAKVDMTAKTVLTTTAVTRSNNVLTSDVRKMEYNMIVLPSQLETNTYIDIRLALPDGQDFIVVSHKQVEIPNIDGIDSLSTIWMNLGETDILILNCAIVESYKIPGSKLYAAQITYVPSDAILSLIRTDPNCVQKAKTALWERLYNKNESGQYTTRKDDVNSAIRNPINGALNNNQDEATDNVTTGVQNDIQKTQEERQKYLDALSGTY